MKLYAYKGGKEQFQTTSKSRVQRGEDRAQKSSATCQLPGKCTIKMYTVCAVIVNYITVFFPPHLKEWDGLVRIAFVRKNKTLSAAFK